MKILPALVLLASPLAADWPGFRGDGTSRTKETGLPLRWSPEENIAWQVELAGFGQSSPVTHGDRLYVTSTGGDQKQRLFVEAFALSDGERLWRREFSASQTAEKVSRVISQGAPTPFADAEGVYAFFESGDLVALDRDGEPRWRCSLVDDFGEFQGVHGIGTSLVGIDRGLALLIDHEGPSYLLTIEREDGATRWKVDRDPRVSWTTPLRIERDGVEQLIVSSNGFVESFRARDGERLWVFDGIDNNNVPSPTRAGELIVAPSSGPRLTMALHLDGEGERGEEAIAWRAERVISSFGSPLVDGELVYFTNKTGRLFAIERTDGSLRWWHPLPDSCWATPVAAPGRLYFFCKNGDSVVIRPDAEEPQVLAENALPIGEDETLYGVAVAGSRFFVRTGRKLFAIGE